MPFILRALSSEQYGYLGALLAAYNILVYLSAFNLSGKISVLVSKKKHSQIIALQNTGLSIYTIIFIFSLITILLLQKFININSIWQDLVILVTLAYVYNVNLSLITVQQFRQNTPTYLLFFAINSFTSLCCTILLMNIFELGVTGRLVSLLTAAILCTILLYLIIDNFPKFDSSVRQKWARKAWCTYALPLMPHSFATIMLANVDKLIIMGSELRPELGRYFLATQLAIPLSIIANSLNAYIKVKVFSELSLNAKSKISGVRNGYLLTIFTLGLGLYIFVYLLQFYTNIFSGLYVMDIFGILLIGHFLQSIYFLYSNYFLYYERGELISKASILGLISHLFLVSLALYFANDIILYTLAYVVSTFIFIITLQYYKSAQGSRSK